MICFYFSAVEGYTNVNAATTYCSSSSCNKVGGTAAGLSVAITSALVDDAIVTDDGAAMDGSSAPILFASVYLVFISFFLI